MLEPGTGWRLVLSRPDPTTRELLGVEVVAEALADDDRHPARCGWAPEPLNWADRILVEQWRRLDARAILAGPQLGQLAAEHLLDAARWAEVEAEAELVN